MPKYLRARQDHPAGARSELWLGNFFGVHAQSKTVALTSSGIQQMLERRSQRVGIRLHAHMLRHWSVEQHLRRGLSEGDAQERYGWSSPAMLRVYARDTAARRSNEHARALAIGDSI